MAIVVSPRRLHHLNLLSTFGNVAVSGPLQRCSNIEMVLGATRRV